MKLDLTDLPAGAYTLTRTADGYSLERQKAEREARTIHWQTNLVLAESGSGTDIWLYYGDPRGPRPVPQDLGDDDPKHKIPMYWANSTSKPPHATDFDMWNGDSPHG